MLASALPAQALEPQLVFTPRASVLKVSATNRPFLAAAQSLAPVALAPRGYAESEHLVKGHASIYEWSGEPRAAAVRVRDANVPWATRILVRRPVDVRKASGLVVVELLDPSRQYDVAPLWGLSAEHFLRRGDVWVGVTVKPIAAATLRRFDPVRYAAVGFAFQQKPECLPDTENGLAFDVIAQVGALLRSSSKENPLLDLNPRHLIAAGWSETAGYVTTYVNAMHRVHRRGDGAPVFDGYLAAAGGPAAPINQCAAPLPDDDVRRAVLPRDVPFVQVMTESDLGRAPRRDDSDAEGDFFRLYEIAGSAQSGPWPAGEPARADLRIAGLAVADETLCVEPRSSFPLGLAFNAVWQQYAEWLALQVPMASVPRIEVDAANRPLRDAAGNAAGGWRLPQLDLPLARYAGQATPRDASERAAKACALTGAMQPFDAARLKALYRSRAEYQQQFRAAVDQAVLERRLVPEDGAALKLPTGLAVPAF